MSLNVKAGGGGRQFDPVSEGGHIARCTQVVDLGTQYSEHYRKSAHKIMLGFEILDEDPDVLDDGTTRAKMVFVRYTASLHERATLRKVLQSWRGKKFTDAELESFSVAALLGAPCYLTVIHAAASNGNVYANVENITQVPKGMQVPPATSEKLLFDIDEPDMDVYAKFGPKLQQTIASAEEWNPPVSEESVQHTDDAPEAVDDDIPF